MTRFKRPIRRTYDQFHPDVMIHSVGPLHRGGAVGLNMNTVGPVGTKDAPYMGMDPSDPLTWTRPYRPEPGMISYLNFDGANVNQTQTTGGRQVYKPRRGR